MPSPASDHGLFIDGVYFSAIFSAVATAWIAGAKGYNRPLWCLAGLFVPNVFVVLLLPNLNEMTDDWKRMRWETGTDFGPYLGFCVLLLMCCHLFSLLNSGFHIEFSVLSCT